MGFIHKARDRTWWLKSEGGLWGKTHSVLGSGGGSLIQYGCIVRVLS